MKTIVKFLFLIVPTFIFSQNSSFDNSVKQIKADAARRGYTLLYEERHKTNYQSAIAFEDVSVEAGYYYIMVGLVEGCDKCPLRFQLWSYATGKRIVINIDNSGYQGNIFMATAKDYSDASFLGRFDYYVNDEFLGIYYNTHALLYRVKK